MPTTTESVRPGDLITAEFANALLERIERLESIIDEGTDQPVVGAQINHRLEVLEQKFSAFESEINKYLTVDTFTKERQQFVQKNELQAQLGTFVTKAEMEGRLGNYTPIFEFESRLGNLVTRSEYQARVNVLEGRFNQLVGTVDVGGITTGPAAGGLVSRETGAISHNLTEIQGIGESRAKMLESAGFGDIQKLSGAAAPEIAKVLGVNEELAGNIIGQARTMLTR